MSLYSVLQGHRIKWVCFCCLFFSLENMRQILAWVQPDTTSLQLPQTSDLTQVPNLVPQPSWVTLTIIILNIQAWGKTHTLQGLWPLLQAHDLIFPAQQPTSKHSSSKQSHTHTACSRVKPGKSAWCYLFVPCAAISSNISPINCALVSLCEPCSYYPKIQNLD